MYRHEELIGVFDWEKNVFQADDPEARTIIGTLEDGTVIKGLAHRGSLECGLTYRFLGRWITHPRWGRQFHFTSFTVSSPAGERATVRYLQKAPGIGSARAQRIWSLYREKALETIRTDPARVAAEVEGMTLERAEGAAVHFRQHERTEKLTLETEGLLAGRSFPRSLPAKVIREWGEDAPRMIREDPYCLMRFHGVGFLRADALYLDLGHNPAAIKRQAYFLQHAITANGEGHTWHRARDLEKQLNRVFDRNQAKFEEALAWATGERLLIVDDRPPDRWIGETAKVAAEISVSECVYAAEREAMVSPPRWPEVRE